jgi:hypothetical protein
MGPSYFKALHSLATLSTVADSAAFYFCISWYERGPPVCGGGAVEASLERGVYLLLAMVVLFVSPNTSTTLLFTVVTVIKQCKTPIH